MPRTYNCIATTTLTSTASSVTFSSIPNTYTDLELVYQTFDSGAFPYWRINDYTATAGYSTILLGYSGGSTVGGADAPPDIYFNWNGASDSNYPMTGVIHFFNYTSSSVKYVLAVNGCIQNTPSNGTESLLQGASRNTSAITSLNFYVSGGHFTTNTTFALYGILKA